MSLGDATPNITLPSDISEETLIAAADRAIGEASTFTDEASQRVVMEESNSSSDEAMPLSTSWDFRRNPSTRRQSSEDLSQFYRRLRNSSQPTPPTVSPVSRLLPLWFLPQPRLTGVPHIHGSGCRLATPALPICSTFHSLHYPCHSVVFHLFNSLPMLQDRDPQCEAMRTVSRSLSIVAQVQGVGEGTVYDSDRWMVRRPEDEFRAAAPAAWEEIRGILADFLYETATRMEDSRRRNTAAPSIGSIPATQPRLLSESTNNRSSTVWAYTLPSMLQQSGGFFFYIYIYKGQKR
ncbi:hypothetical protein J6590_103395 [Homalodisca vitripennis]|nr:hypothetical protein J6590_091473 [Homalodisca vitripennis]KAG8289478.1 hypothetical protein J6590_103395 [Homalodisca vitripennis]